MKHIGAKILSLLCLALLFTLVPGAGAYADTISGVSYQYYDDAAVIAGTPKTGTVTEYTTVTDSTAAVTWNSGWYVVSEDAAINVPSKRIEVNGEVNLILMDGKTLTAKQGIHVGSNATLNIYAQSTGDGAGTLIANGFSGGAGIGGKAYEAGGTITIHGGTVRATGGESGGAGIGGGMGGAGGTITIHGGAVTGTGKSEGAGIGGGSTGTGGTITINGGTVNATGGESGGAGIGGGVYGEGGTITINGGTVNATGGQYGGAGIGSGSRDEGEGGTITINGGTVNATGGERGGAGIGGGDEGEGGTVIINDGEVTATGGEYSGAGIGGGGDGGAGGDITIKGGTVNATGGNQAAGIGGGGGDEGEGGAGGVITIEGGTVKASGGQYGAGIGGGLWSAGGNVTINGGTVKASGGDEAAGIGGGAGGSDAGTVSLGNGMLVWAGAGEDPQNDNKNIALSFETTHSQRYVYATISPPIITGADLVLNGSLDLRFYVALPKGFDGSGAYMSFTIPGRNPETGTTGRSVNVYFADADNATDGQKIFPCPVYSIEMAQNVEAVFHYKENDEDKTATLTTPVSVKDYLALADAQYPDNTKLHALTNAARDYGHYMQLYLAELHGFTVGTDDETYTYDYQTMPNASEITALTALDGYKTVWNSTPTSVLKAVGYYDTFNETTTLNILFRVADGTGTITATAGGVTRDVESVDEQGVAFGSNTYRIRIPDIAANNLDHAYHVQLSADGNTFCDMNVSALTYVSTMLANGSPTENEAKALTALYNYNVAADGYNQ